MTATKSLIGNHERHERHENSVHKTLKTLKKASQTSAVMLMAPFQKGHAE
jgi:hypothetical protein